MLERVTIDPFIHKRLQRIRATWISSGYEAS
jgi:hypothetical protein